MPVTRTHMPTHVPTLDRLLDQRAALDRDRVPVAPLDHRRRLYAELASSSRGAVQEVDDFSHVALHARMIGVPNSKCKARLTSRLLDLPNMLTLADRIQHALDVRGKKAADLARACGVRPPSVSDWLTGETKSLKAHTAIKAATFLSVNIAWLTQGLGVSGLETPAQFDTIVTAPTKATEPAPRYAPWPFKVVTREAIEQLADHQLLDRLERTMVTRIAEILQDAGLHPDQAVGNRAAA